MTTATLTNLVWRASTTAENFNWIKKISDALTAVGVLLTADTGQIVLTGTTVALPSTPDSTFKASGYQIRKLESAGKPTIYMRIEYGVRRGIEFADTAACNFPAMKITFGTETNGAGVIAGAAFDYSIYTAAGYYRYAQNTPATQRPLYFSSDGGNYLTMLIDPNIVGAGTISQTSAYSPIAMVIERSIDASTGVYDGEGMIVIQTNMDIPSGSPSVVRQVVNIPAGAKYTSASVPAQTDSMFSSSGSADATTVFPVTVLLPKVKGPMKSLLYFYTADAVPGLTFSATMYGETHTYITTGVQTGFANAPNASCLGALRYD